MKKALLIALSITCFSYATSEARLPKAKTNQVAGAVHPPVSLTDITIEEQSKILVEAKEKNVFQKAASAIASNKTAVALILIAAFIAYHEMVNPFLEKSPYWPTSAKEAGKILSGVLVGDLIKDYLKDEIKKSKPAIFGEEINESDSK